MVTLRIVFGLAMCISTVRFLWLGWVEDQYLRPLYHFSYYGFEWVKVAPPWALYSVYGLMLAASLGILVGMYYRLSTVFFFLTFTYVELLDKTYYLNHYYFVSLMALLFCMVPAHRFFSWDAYKRPSLSRTTVPAWCVYLLQFQIGCVYFFAGIAKINPNWLLEAMPLRMWLPAQDDMPFLGPFLRKTWVAYAFSWVGMLYDLCISFLLLGRKTRLPSYCILLVFHALTGYFFQIGVFPLVMSLCTLVFFSEGFHKKFLSGIAALLRISPFSTPLESGKKQLEIDHRDDRGHSYRKLSIVLLTSYVLLQVLLPFRYVLYPGNLFWTEEGYRFSWRVMLVEKAGSAIFKVRNNATGGEFEVVNRQFLNTHQEKQMAFQPDMILQYAHFLGEHYKARGLRDISVFCDCQVTLNGRPSRPIVDPNQDLLPLQESVWPKKWITTLEEHL